MVTASGVDNDGSRTTARDDAVVRLVDVPPTITVVKDADPASRVDPGGAFTFFVTVNNTSFEPVTVVSLTDDVYGNLNGRGTCAIGAVIPAGGSYRCQFTVDYRGPGGSSQVDRVFATVVDNDGSRASANDDARISITPIAGAPIIVPTVPPAAVAGRWSAPVPTWVAPPVWPSACWWPVSSWWGRRGVPGTAASPLLRGVAVAAVARAVAAARW